MRDQATGLSALLGKLACSFLTLGVVASMSVPARAQLEVTEVMFQPNNFAAWEWIEIRNTGTEAVDLDGAYMDRIGDNALDTSNPSISPNIENTVAENTIIPAGGVAILYDAFISGSSPANFNDQLFRDAWSLNSNVPIIGVSFFPALINTGSTGLWANADDYDSAIIDDPENPGTNIIGSFNNALFSIDYTTGFPGGNGMSSIQWNGTGSNGDGANWALSENGTNGAVTSVIAGLPGAPINSANDVGNPGLTSGSAPTGSLLITEVMYNPSSSDASWEWVEIYNNTGSLIDFASTPYVFDDNDNNDLEAANVTSGSVPQGSIAILYDGDDVTPEQAQAAWDPGGTNGLNLIPVSDFTALTNGGGEEGDTIALWDDFGDYTSEPSTGQGRTTENAAVTVTYKNATEEWPDDNGFSSIYLLDIGADPGVGDNWALSADGDFVGSFNATDVIGSLTIHPGGDIASPGSFGVVTPPNVDLDDDGDVDGADFLAIQRTNPSLIGEWQVQFGSTGGSQASTAAVPEPTSIVLFGLAAVMLPMVRRQRA